MGAEGLAIRAGFLDFCGKHYQGGFKEVDFATSSEAARKEINAWVEEKTNDKIKELLASQVKTLQAEVFVDLQRLGFLRSRKKAAASPPLVFSLRVIPAAVEAQFVIPFDAMKAVFDDSLGKRD